MPETPAKGHNKPTPADLISELEIAILEKLDSLSDEYCIYSRAIFCGQVNLRTTKAILHGMTDKGLVRLVQGLMNEDDGMLAGSGYTITHKGRTTYREHIQ